MGDKVFDIHIISFTQPIKKDAGKSVLSKELLSEEIISFSFFLPLVYHQDYRHPDHRPFVFVEL